MTPEFKTQWVAALRSGAYAQAKTVLRNTEGGHCCLGVACDLIDSSRWAVMPRRINHLAGYNWGECPAEETGRPLGMALALDVDMVRTLASKNDSGVSFAEIAEWIEQNVPTQEAQP